MSAPDVLTVPAVLLDALGEPGTCRVGEIDVPAPGPGQVRLRVEACAVNPVDVKLASIGNPSWTWPHVLGLDVLGVVEAIGDGVDRALLDARVLVHHDLRQQGGFAGAVLIDAAAMATVPDAVPDVAAAALPCAGLTAAQAVDRTGVGPNDRVLVVGAGGGVGTYATQLAVRTGAKVVGVCGAVDDERVRRLGAAATIDHHAGDLVEQARDLDPFDVVLDMVAASSTTPSLGLLRFNGRFATVGRPDLSVVPLYAIAPTLVYIALGKMYSHGVEAHRRAAARRLNELLIADLEPPPTHQVGLDETPAAMQAVKERRRREKVIVRP